jgi:hypothetical protein
MCRLPSLFNARISAPGQVLEMHVDGFRFDLGSILTRAHSRWHAVDPADAGGGPDDAEALEAAAGAAAANGAVAVTEQPAPPRAPGAPGGSPP